MELKRLLRPTGSRQCGQREPSLPVLPVGPQLAEPAAMESHCVPIGCAFSPHQQADERLKSGQSQRVD